MGHDAMAEPGRKSYCRLGCKKLRRQRTGKTHDTQPDHHQAHLNNVACVLIADAGIDDFRHHQRNQ